MTDPLRLLDMPDPPPELLELVRSIEAPPPLPPDLSPLIRGGVAHRIPWWKIAGPSLALVMVVSSGLFTAHVVTAPRRPAVRVQRAPERPEASVVVTPRTIEAPLAPHEARAPISDPPSRLREGVRGRVVSDTRGESIDPWANGPTRRSGGQIEPLLDQALGDGQRPIAASAPSTPSRGELRAAIGRMASQVQGCSQGWEGTVNVRATFESSGAVQSAAASGDVPPPVLRCIEAVVRHARVPPFRQPTLEARHSFRIRARRGSPVPSRPSGLLPSHPYGDDPYGDEPEPRRRRGGRFDPL